MGLLDNLPPIGTKAIAAGTLISLFAVCLAMLLAPPTLPVLGPGSDDGNFSALDDINGADCAWILISAALVLLMSPGIAFFYGGLADNKNVVTTMMQSVIPLGIVPILFCFLGFSLAFGPTVEGTNGILGDPEVYGLMYNVGAVPDPNLSSTIPVTLFLIYQTMFAVLTPAIIVGSVANRVNFSSLCVFIFLWHFIVYCPVAHMVWYPTGLIKEYGILDFAGGAVVHMSSGWAALAAAIYLGPKKRSPAKAAEVLAHKHSDDGQPREERPRLHTPANQAHVLLGTAMLWFGWFGFNAGSALGAGYLAAQAFLNTNIAAATSMVTWLLLDTVRGTMPGPVGLSMGAVVGLVAITPAAGFVTVGGASVIGILGATFSTLVQILMQRLGSHRVEDTADVFICHGIGGTTGMLLTSLFQTVQANPGAIDGGFYGNGVEFGKALLVCVLLIIWYMVATLACLFIADKILKLRVSEEEEDLGLDISKHGGMVMAHPVYPQATVALANVTTTEVKPAPI